MSSAISLPSPDPGAAVEIITAENRLIWRIGAVPVEVEVSLDGQRRPLTCAGSRVSKPGERPCDRGRSADRPCAQLAPIRKKR